MPHPSTIRRSRYDQMWFFMPLCGWKRTRRGGCFPACRPHTRLSSGASSRRSAGTSIAAPGVIWLNVPYETATAVDRRLVGPSRRLSGSSAFRGPRSAFGLPQGSLPPPAPAAAVTRITPFFDVNQRNFESQALVGKDACEMHHFME